MGLLLLLTSTLLSSYFHPGSVVNAQHTFTIRDISLSIEPSTDVTRGTNVTVRCKVTVSSSGQEALSREYTIFKDGSIVYTKTTSSSEDFLYPLPEARVSNSGKYKCKIKIGDRQSTSEAKKLTVRGLSKPVLHLNKGVVTEGEELTATCMAPGETGSIFFYFYDNSKEIQEKLVNSNQAVAELRFRSTGIHKIHCAYTVLLTPDSFKSEESNSVTVSVKELDITVVLEISPQYSIFEGDRLNIFCSIQTSQRSTEKMFLYLSEGTSLLSSGAKKVNHSMVALAKTGGLMLECRMEMGHLVKTANKTLPVTELFSAPTLTVSPAEVFQREPMTLTCKSESFASERLQSRDLTYTLYSLGNPLKSGNSGIFSGKALQHEFNYTCTARAKGIEKHSQTLTVRPRVFVSAPKISVSGKAILGQPIQILCESDTGSLPINYTLWKGYGIEDMTTVHMPFQKALFTVSISKPEEIKLYMCEANNGRREEGPFGARLTANVTVPLSHAMLSVLPALHDISEEGHLNLICSVEGTPPVTFKWYRVGESQPLNATTSDQVHKDYEFPVITKAHSGKYYCEAFNHAKNIVRSNEVTVEVRMAMWKKALIGGICLLIVTVLVLVFGLYFRSKRVRVDRAAVSVWSERKPEAGNDEESSMVSNEPDVEYTEVVHPRSADPARVPLRKGTDTVYSELQNSPHGAADHHDYGSVEYAELNGEQPEISQHHPQDSSYQDLPEPVD
ncbi:platelet endothelial cell adhesion molecule isoform X4 [Acanthochromis polyacanthus]|uniref:platelet endothelial cell adhesion molecule isoform X4 n=1 Tax=Acanthochromis polyacanthus TaxID=80966 RepID=UPI0022345481|nr:platelet endothelial cell adhesion molecule isoform X4 [Acanthochromis polyacanthus]